MVQYDWEILSLYTVPSLDGLSNVIKRITWRYQAKDGVYAGDIYRDTHINEFNLNGFVEFDELTKENIIGWIESIEDMDQIRSIVLEKLNESKNPSIVEKKCPWDYESKFDSSHKFVLVHNNQVVYGPVFWHSDLMNNELKKLNLEPSIPTDFLAIKQGIVPFNKPTIVNDSIQIFRVELQNEQPEDSIFTDNGNIIWDFATGVANGIYVAVDRPLDDIKSSLKNIVANTKDQKEVQGTNVTINGVTYKILTGPLSRLLLVEKINVMGDNDSCMWKFMENNWVEVSKANISVMLNVVDSYVQNLLDWEYNLVQQIDSANSINSLKEINLN